MTIFKVSDQSCRALHMLPGLTRRSSSLIVSRLDWHRCFQSRRKGHNVAVPGFCSFQHQYSHKMTVHSSSLKQTPIPIGWPPTENADPDMQQILAPSPPPSLHDDSPAWSDNISASSLDVRRRIFCNRSLNMAHIKAVGFDMDYTLSQYRPETFEMLAYTLTVQKLVDVFGYPQVIKDFKFDWRYMVRGLTIDKKQGSILKIDRHKYVKLAFHGFEELSHRERHDLYNNAKVRYDYDEPDFATIDTLFSLAEAYLFMQLVELHDADPCALPGKTYPDIYREVRTAVDLCHRDGSLKQAVAADPGKYIHEDLRLKPLLEAFRSSGRKLFLATNSLWDYTHVVMNFLINQKTGSERNDQWLEYFDAVVVGCGKPGFFSEKKPLFEVHTSTGMLLNTSGGSAITPIGEADLPNPGYDSSAPEGLSASAEGAKARVFQGGNHWDLHKMLDVNSGAEVLYVSDHIYADLNMSKKWVGWRTMLVVPELQTELILQTKFSHVQSELRALRQQREALEDQIERSRRMTTHGDKGASDNGFPSVEELEAQKKEIKDRHSELLEAHHQKFHKIWGQLMKTGYQNSRFAHQVERFACLYTSHVSNLSFYSPNKSYRGRVDYMAHEEAAMPFNKS